MNYQSEAVKKFANLKVGALFMDMGTGKTKTILDIYLSKNIDIPIVYILPYSLGANTNREIKKWYPELSDRIKWFSCESIGSSDTKMMELNSVIEGSFLIVDESIKFKNLESKRTDRLLKICHKASYRFILNGTPISRSILDLLAQMNILSPKILNMTESEFANRFLVYKLENGNKAPWRSWSKPTNEEALMSIIEPYVFNQSYHFDYKVFTQDIHTNLNDDELEEYQEFKESLLTASQIDFLKIAQMFQMFYTFNIEKYQTLNNLLSDDIPTLYFVKYLNWVEFFKQYDVGFYTGQEKCDTNGEHKNIVLTYGCGSYGLNLQHYKRIVFVDSTFDYGMQIQAKSRIIRMGQDSDVQIINLWTNTGLEEIIETSIKKKSCTAQNIKKILENMDKEGLRKL